MLTRRSKLRAGALIAASALGLHELRYLIGYGGDAGRAVADQGHAYLPLAGALIVLLIALAAVQLAAAVVGAVGTGAGERRPAPFWLVWALAGLALLGVHAGQELAEGLLASGHPAGLAAITAHGGLVAVPLAFGLGLVVALALRGAEAAIAAARRSRPPAPPRRAALREPRPGAVLGAPRSCVLARNLAGRAPPAVS
jgi:hypothetical protein